MDGTEQEIEDVRRALRGHGGLDPTAANVAALEVLLEAALGAGVTLDRFDRSGVLVRVCGGALGHGTRRYVWRADEVEHAPSAVRAAPRLEAQRLS